MNKKIGNFVCAKLLYIFLMEYRELLNDKRIEEEL